MRTVAGCRAHGRAATAGSIAAALALLTACSSSTTRLPDESAASALDEGAISGAIRLVGGPAGTPSPAPVAGEVFAYRDANLTGDPVATAKAVANGRFELRLPPGRYYLAGTSPSYSIDPAPPKPPCRGAAAVDVAAGATSTADVVCAMK